jgi:D-alanyl-D-alanine dipeptidase
MFQSRNNTLVAVIAGMLHAATMTALGKLLKIGRSISMDLVLPDEMTPSDAEIKLDDHVPLWTMGYDRKIQNCCNKFLSNPNTICVWTVRSKHSRGAGMDIFEFQPKPGELVWSNLLPNTTDSRSVAHMLIVRP